MLNSVTMANFCVLDPIKHRSEIVDIQKRFVTIDKYSDQIEELWRIRNPRSALTGTPELIEQRLAAFKKKIGTSTGKWIFYPWRNLLVHVLNDRYFQEVRTSRNKYLINNEEQLKFEGTKVAIAGLSVGNSVALTLRLQGGAKNINLADFDELSLSNLNRVRAGITELGMPKIEIASRQILEIDPYTKLGLFSKGINDQNIDRFLKNVDVVFDEVDSMPIKVLLRIKAREKKIPLIMLTDNDDGVLIDYYPYHEDQNTPIFYGVKDQEVFSTIAKKNLSKMEMVAFSSKVVGVENISERMIQSLKSVGEDLYTWPQLGTAAIFSGVVGAYLVRMITTGAGLKMKRSLIRLNDLI